MTFIAMVVMAASLLYALCGVILYYVVEKPRRDNP